MLTQLIIFELLKRNTFKERLGQFKFMTYLQQMNEITLRIVCRLSFTHCRASSSDGRIRRIGLDITLRTNRERISSSYGFFSGSVM